MDSQFPLDSPFPIDFVLLWVDGGDPAWRAKKAKYLPEVKLDDPSNGEQRYRDWDLLRHWFRGVEKFAPWVRSIFFVTDDQWPEWLNKDAPKLVCTSHRDFIPEDCLPTFNSNAIEMNLWRINGLSEHFVEFNDDTFLLRPISEDAFFHNGLPVIEPRLAPVVAFYPNRPVSYFFLHEAAIVNQHFSRVPAYGKNFWKWICPWKIGFKLAFWNLLFSFFEPCPGFADPHLPFFCLKSTIEKIATLEPDLFNYVSGNRFRTDRDIGPRLFRDWQLASGRFWPRRISKIGMHCSIIPREIDRLCDTIANQRRSMVCANDIGYLSEKDFSWSGRLQKGAALDFVKNRFDILLDISTETTYPVHYVQLSSVASYKVGRYIETDLRYDLLIDTKEDNSIAYLITQINVYLSKIKIKH